MTNDPDSPLSACLVDIAINDPAWEKCIFMDVFETQVGQLLESVRIQVCPWLKNAEVSVILTNDAESQYLNKTYRHQDKPTNVLSFGYFNEPITCDDIQGPQPVLLGDIILSLETLKIEAEEQSKDFNDHVSHMIVHGFLHLLGYDHITDQEAEAMEAIEINVLKHYGIANPYEMK